MEVLLKRRAFSYLLIHKIRLYLEKFELGRNNFPKRLFAREPTRKEPENSPKSPSIVLCISLVQIQKQSRIRLNALNPDPHRPGANAFS